MYLKPGKRLYATDAGFFGDSLLQVRRDKGFYDDAMRLVAVVQYALFEMFLGSIPRHQRADLISREKSHFALGVSGGYSHAIAVRIGSDYEIGVGIVRELHGHRQRLGIFWIWRFDGRKPAVRHVLFGNGLAMEAEAIKHWFDDDPTDTMKRAERPP